MKIFILKLRSKIRINVDGQKRDLKKWHQVITLSLSEYNKYAPYSDEQIFDIDDKKLLKLIKANLEKLGANEITNEDTKIGKKEAQARYDSELERREELKEEEEEIEDDEDNTDDDNSDTDSSDDDKWDDSDSNKDDDENDDDKNWDDSEKDNEDKTNTPPVEDPFDENK